MPATNPLDTCLVAIHSNGIAVGYTCNNKTASFTPTSWIVITACNNYSCADGSTAWVSYACGVCVPAGNGVYYQFTCSQSGSTITYNYANYSSPDCFISGLIYSQTSNIVPINTYILRNPYANPVESNDLSSGYYSHASYALVIGSVPPSIPYSGPLKK